MDNNRLELWMDAWLVALRDLDRAANIESLSGSGATLPRLA